MNSTTAVKDQDFEAAKKFSDFIGFHVRFIFCSGAAWFALLIPISAFLEARLTGGSYGAGAHKYELIAFFAISIYACVLLFFILRSVRNYFRDHAVSIVRRLSWVFIGLAGLVEITFIVVLLNVIFHQTLNLVQLDREVSICLMNEFVLERGIMSGAPREGCTELLLDARATRT